MSRRAKFLFGCAAALSSHAFGADFQLKGATLGMGPEAACKGAPVSDGFGDLIRKYKAQAPALRDMGTSECNPEIDSFGGVAPSGPAHLQFMGGRLILMKIELESISAEQGASIITALRQQHGAPKLTKSAPFTTHSWKKGQAVLFVEHSSRSWDDIDMLVMLRDETAYAEFDKRTEYNRRQLRKLDEEATRQDITK